MNKYFKITGEILYTNLDKVVSIFEADTTNWNLRYKNAATLFVKLTNVDLIIYKHRDKQQGSDFLMEGNIENIELPQVQQVVANIGKILEHQGIVYNFEFYEEAAGEIIEEYTIAHAMWGK